VGGGARVRVSFRGFGSARAGGGGERAIARAIARARLVCSGLVLGEQGSAERANRIFPSTSRTSNAAGTHTLRSSSEWPLP
jgi:hypothetical protein